MRPIYDKIGVGYLGARREDPRIAARIAAALGDTRTVLNVGAGTGNYEPRDRRVIAVEPSPVMITQRAAKAAPAVRATAEYLPFRDSAFDASMMVLTVHHWTDKARGLAEVRRVTSGPVAMFTAFDPSLNVEWWLHDYFPASKALVASRIIAPEVFAAVLGPATLIPVPIPADCADGFEAAYWRRPAAILNPAVWRATSALSMISAADRAAGMSRLAADLASGAWRDRYGHLLSLDELDLGYRVMLVQ